MWVCTDPKTKEGYLKRSRNWLRLDVDVNSSEELRKAARQKRQLEKGGEDARKKEKKSAREEKGMQQGLEKAQRAQ